MRCNLRIKFWLLALIGIPMATDAMAEFKPGDVFREYYWRPEGKWQRVTGPDATHEGAQRFLPNAVNTILIDDLENAARIEAVVEMLLCHGGTVNKRMRVNQNHWISIPESSLIPGEVGTGGPRDEYQSMRYPWVEIPLDQIQEGENTFEFTCSGGTALGKRWPQWILYGVTFRVYYDQVKPHPTGSIVSPSAGASHGSPPVLEVQASGTHPIRQVDYIGFYEDFNWEGDGEYRQWHHRTLFGSLYNHIGSATETPFRVTWDTS